ncbi:MAG: hypothetical protein EON92_05455 [Burkholderiales bacterium]|nr:MAG: hypothetical protein EON92_05455 [Burkholderiales bacterium]
MGFAYISVEAAIASTGVRMVVVGEVPSPWSEAAKGIFHVKRIPWAAVRLAYDNHALKAWAGQRSAPIVVVDDEPPRSGWADILQLAQRITPTAPLLPENSADRALVLGLAQEVCGENGLGWMRRLQLVDAGLREAGGFHPKVAAYIGKKYGYSAEAASTATSRVVQILGMLTERLRSQQAAGSKYYVGKQLTAVDIYSATFMALLRPLAHNVCPMDAVTRQAFEYRDPATDAALSDVLLGHRDMMYRDHLALPLSL